MHTIKVLIIGLGCLLSNVVASGGDLLTNCSSPEVRAKIMSVCSAEVGQRETLGPNDSPRIREYKRAIHSSFNYPVAWCAIFVTYTYTRAGLKPAGNEWVPSWSKDPRSVIYTRGAPRNQYPCPGDVVTFYYARLGYEGHIGLVKEWPPTGDYFYTIEGNTNNAGSREGDGVYVKMHRKSDAYKIMRFV